MGFGKRLRRIAKPLRTVARAARTATSLVRKAPIAFGSLGGVINPKRYLSQAAQGIGSLAPMKLGGLTSILGSTGSNGGWQSYLMNLTGKRPAFEQGSDGLMEEREILAIQDPNPLFLPAYESINPDFVGRSMREEGGLYEPAYGSEFTDFQYPGGGPGYPRIQARTAGRGRRQASRSGRGSSWRGGGSRVPRRYFR